MKTDYFWTDPVQAQERIRGTVLLYDDTPVYVQEIINADDGPKARIYRCGDPDMALTRKNLNSPKFNRFRTLPNLGWCNLSSGRVVFIERRVVTGRSHGLSGNNVSVYSTLFEEDRVQFRNSISFEEIMNDEGFVNTHKEVFPSLIDVFKIIKPSTGIAITRMFCLVKDSLGICWLYRNREKIGLFTGVDTLNLLQKFSYLREEVMAERRIDVNTIKEF